MGERRNHRDERHESWFRLALQLRAQLRERMAAQGITHRELAKRMKREPAQISHWLSGSRPNLTLRSLVLLANAVGCAVTIGLSFEESPAVASNENTIEDNNEDTTS